MPNNLDALTTISTAFLALFSVLTASACDDAEDPAQRAAFAATDDDNEDEDPLDWVSDPMPQAALAPNGFIIEDVVTNGKGCPNPDSVDVLLSPKNTLVRILYHEMVLEQSPGPAIQTTSCTTALKLNIPDGWKVAPASVKTQGYAYLDKNVKARRSSSMFFAGSPGVKFDTNLQGPRDDAYKIIDVPAAPKWSSCGGSTIFSITTNMVLNTAANPTGNAYFTLHDQRLLSWQFKEC